MKKAKRFVQFAGVFLLSGLMVACGGKKSDDGAALSPMRTARASGPANPTVGPQSFLPSGNYKSEIGYVYVDNADNSVFQLYTQGLASAQMDADYLGDVDNLKGIRVQGKVKVNGTTLDTKESQILIQIHDSEAGKRVGDEVIPPVSMSLRATSFQYQQATGKITVVFKDTLGSITIEGTIYGNDFVGVFSYANEVIFKPGNEGYDTPAVGTLGSFKIPWNGFFQFIK